MIRPHQRDDVLVKDEPIVIYFTEAHAAKAHVRVAGSAAIQVETLVFTKFKAFARVWSVQLSCRFHD